MSKQIDVSGERFGKLVAIRRTGYKKYPSGGGLSIWECECDCGKVVEVSLSALRTGNTSSCGCLHKEIMRDMHGEHFETNTRLYRVWKQMRKRCNNPNCREYRWYGANGVRVCDEWENSYELFRDWMIEHGYDESAERGKFTIDRINPFGNYEPENCRIVSMDVQLHNRRKDWNGVDRRSSAESRQTHS